MADEVDKLINEIVDYYVQKAEEDFPIASTFANNEMYDELNKMYDSFIRQFYRYETQSYIRHWEGSPGTKTGTNLYYGNQIKKRMSYGLPYLEIDFDARNMAGYRRDSADTVLNQVMSGELQVHGSKGYVVYSREWTGSFRGKYFSYTGKMDDAFSRFYDKYEDHYLSAFMIKWRQLGWP